MYRASSLSWLVKPESLIMSMLLVVTHRLWSIIGDSGSFVSPVGPLALAPLSFHALTGNLGSRPFAAVEFKSDGAVIGLIDAVVIQLPDRPCNLNTDHLKGETFFVPLFSYI